MGKKKKLIVVLILVIAILAATAIVVSTLFDEETQYEEYILHNCAISAVHSIEVNLEDGTKYTMFADDENYLSWEMQYPEGGKDAQYSSDSMFNVAYACALVRYERKIGIPTQEDLVKYGLDTPQSVVTLTKDNGNSITFYVGDKTVSNGTYYFMVEDDENVYTINNSSGQYLLLTPVQHRKLSIAGVKLEDFQEIKFQFQGNDPIEIHRDNSTDSLYNPFQNYIVVSPYKVGMPTDGTAFLAFYDDLPVLSFQKIVCDNPTEAQLKEFGLDDPYLTYSIVPMYSEKDSVDLVVGKYADEYNYARYVYDRTTNIVGSISNDYFKVFDVNPLKLTTTLLFSAYLDKLEYVEYTIDGRVDVIRHFRHYKTSESAGSDGPEFESTYTLNNMDVNSDHVSAMYIITNNFHIKARYTGDETGYSAESALKIKFTPFDKEKEERVLEFRELNEDGNFYVTLIDGEADFIVSKEDVDLVIQGIEDIKKGEKPSYVIK